MSYCVLSTKLSRSEYKEFGFLDDGKSCYAIDTMDVECHKKLISMFFHYDEANIQ